MTSREVVIRTLTFNNPDRLALSLTPEYGNDFAWTGMDTHPDARPSSGIDEWGAIWENQGTTSLGEVKDPPLKDWERFDELKVPDLSKGDRWKHLPSAREIAGDKFLLGTGISLYERAHFIRGLENLWADIYEAPDNLCRLLDILVDMNLTAIEHYADAGVDGLLWCDDWGLQNRLMISPVKWREIWKPRYEKIYKTAHEAGILNLLHSCGYIVDILDDLIEAGLDAILMAQQENMGVELLGRRFGGKITFMCPVDIQSTMVYGNNNDIRDYCHQLIKAFASIKGGFIADCYQDIGSVGHTEEALNIECDEWKKISIQMFGK